MMQIRCLCSIFNSFTSEGPSGTAVMCYEGSEGSLNLPRRYKAIAAGYFISGCTGIVAHATLNLVSWQLVKDRMLIRIDSGDDKGRSHCIYGSHHPQCMAYPWRRLSIDILAGLHLFQHHTCECTLCQIQMLMGAYMTAVFDWCVTLVKLSSDVHTYLVKSGTVQSYPDTCFLAGSSQCTCS